MPSRGDVTVDLGLSLIARDERELAADLFTPPPEKIRAVCVLAPAMGVRRGFYRPFARYLAEGGLVVLVPDYRGIGGSAPPSLRGFKAELHEWAALDLHAALDELRRRFPNQPAVWVGHSVGGQLFGILARPPVARALLISSQSGNPRCWRGVGRTAITVLWYFAIPILTWLLGWMPMRVLRQGENLPAGVAQEWARWGRHPDYILSYARSQPQAAFFTYSGPLRGYIFSDDPWAPRAGVLALLAGFTATEPEVIHVEPHEVGLPSLGHFGAFRPTARERLWPTFRAWLLDEPGAFGAS